MVVLVGVEFALLVRQQLLLRHRLVGHVGELEDVVDHLLLEDRRAQRLQRVGILPVIVEDLLLLAAVAPRLVVERALQLLVGDGDLGSSRRSSTAPARAAPAARRWRDIPCAPPPRSCPPPSKDLPWCSTSCITCRQMFSNSCSTRFCGSGKACILSSWSSICRFTFWRVARPYSPSICLLQRLAQLVDRFQAQPLGELVVER